MIQSMTGFGKAVVIAAGKKITAEVKSLNSKQADVAMRLPAAAREIELGLRNLVATRLQRGKIEVWINSEPIEASSGTSFNLPLLNHYKAQIIEMSKQLDLPLPEDWYATLLRLPDALNNEASATEVSAEELDAMQKAVEQALDALVEFRIQEGNRLAAFFVEKINAIDALLQQVPKYEQPRVEKIKGRIIEALSKLEGIEYDGNRLEQELIFYIEKLDISEEKLRLANHLKYFVDTLETVDPGQGKKLGFIAQEMGREINTLGSKANQAELQKVVVNMKDHLEQIKEQVLNVL